MSTTPDPTAEPEAFTRGTELRRAVLGARHVERSIVPGAEPTDLQRLITEFGWGTVWARPGLARRERSIATVSMLIALNRPHELRIHLRGALNNGCTPAEIREVIVHAIPYCGFPAAIDANRVFEAVLADDEHV
ncbi:carboxymuconolactone decarboxylase family protein [Pseudonocardia halophobica]|uniref:4-carboxymuconolactone decarboxylase n=1 Tax=Pseudonocardia halophobica TaxID=29401 RepID=A0A9W6KZ35_9PSEU|nr:carboxymuconolactone decarboxylase family protein [Pseudonocardia halophobica]GLL10621.1 4-carboxymuconolactone decarboxylase [Pseudonocardia halophobica]